jgi:hypothetical protein
LTDAIAGVNLKPENSSVALEEIVSRDGKKTTFEEFIRINLPVLLVQKSQSPNDENKLSERIFLCGKSLIELKQ